ncbi:BrnA antitoxin family protein [Variovorax sp. J2P1-59]|uniref:BrnA antitoxin family protein n=1 Tax=Variovorax flavidus TaxID=3053501 RepID=UPI002578B291|nr:BrnA antitoxin family protein [Variovorax sp. J2P1-59]MDM0077274.1 BrnA antitoxin family protein [Variovorax sp. J2P1-59]
MTAKLPSTPSGWVDPDDAPELTDEFFRDAKPTVSGREVTREEYAAAVKTARRGRPPLVRTKVSTTIRFDAEVLAALKATGPGWQTRANDALRADLEAGRL